MDFHFLSSTNSSPPLLFPPDTISILVQSIFLLLLFFYFLLKQHILNNPPPSKTTPPPTQMLQKKSHFLHIQHSLISKTCILSSTLLLSAHLYMLLIPLFHNHIHHSSPLWATLSSEITQTILWSSSLFFCLQNLTKKPPKFHCFLRSWWIFSFFLSLFHSLYPSPASLTTLLCLLPSAVLLFLSVNGRTGLSPSSPPPDHHRRRPLLEKTEKNNKECIYGSPSFLQRITFSWLNPLFVSGFKQPLNQDDIPEVDGGDSAEFLSVLLEEKLERLKKGDDNDNPPPSIYRAVFLLARNKAVTNGLFAVVTAVTSYIGPYLIEDFVLFLGTKKAGNLKNGYLLASGFLCAKVVETVCQRQWIFGARQLGMRLRAALTAHIYKKGLVLSSRSRQSHTSGEIINYMSVDILRITDFVWYLNTIWMLPIQITLAMYVLRKNLGRGSMASLAATLVIMGCNIPIARKQKWYQRMMMESKDKRMRSTAEVLRNVKVLKLQGWDEEFRRRLERQRETEYGWLWRSQMLSAASTFIFWGAPTIISLITFVSCGIMGVELTTGRVLSALATFRMLQEPIFNLPDLLSVVAQGKVSADRVASFLREEEIEDDVVEFVPPDQTELAVEICGGSFIWGGETERGGDGDGDKGRGTLSGIDLRVIKGMKVAICGAVGSGKSSLLSCILGDMAKIEGTVKVSGSMAYVPQSPWILTGNIKDNILFGKPYGDGAMYERTVEACALCKDFDLLVSRDLTEIGERGINMSGGQKQRIQIARAMYQDADICLFDDPFSAVDAHTGTKLFKECIMGALKEKTILYVTHQVEFLPVADLVLVMQNGRIIQAGKYEELMKQNTGFEILVGAHNEALESIMTVTEKGKMARHDTIPRIRDIPKEHRNGKLENTEERQPQDIGEKAGKLLQEEERETGSIGKEVYFSYLTSVKRGALVPLILLAQSTFQVLQIASNYWMACATPSSSSDGTPMRRLNWILSVYALLSVGSSLCVLVRAMLVSIVGLSASQKLFTSMLHSVLRAPMSFFDSTPTGRILNRASTDQSVVDLEIANRIGWCAFSIIQIIGTIAVMSQVAWEVFAIVVPATAICILYQRYYIPTARELARLAGIQISPLLHHFSESLSGAATIRAFGQKSRFIHQNFKLTNNHSRPWFHNVAAMEWLSFRLNQLSNFVFGFSLFLLVSLPEGIINPSIAGLAITYGINLNVLQAQVIWNLCNTDNKMISVERILQYSKLSSEAPLVIDDYMLHKCWPEHGQISFKNLQIRYAEHFPPVLQNITCTLPGGKKVGVVGRTGSGKSTLIQAIFRIMEATEGSIEIDEVDISRIGLHDLRSRLSIIPQDPTLFEGTIRGNLDPLEKYSDFDIWEALDKCQMGDIIRSKENKLDSSVVENGENWSVGQRQLFCLGRALLKKSSILILDEATASVDTATDGVVQKIITREFKDRTVVTIAHRIHTVIESDLILVLSDGRVLEYDTPLELLKREDSCFSGLIKEYSARSRSFDNVLKLDD